MRKFFAILFICMYGELGSAAIYHLEWEFPKELDFDVQLFELSPAYDSKVGTNGIISDTSQLTPISEFKNGVINLQNKKFVIIGLVFKSRSGKDADFYVAPHSTEPGESSLDFQFNCLCYHHAYHMKKGFLWYRVLKLSIADEKALSSLKPVVLKHKVVVWKGEAKSK